MKSIVFLSTCVLSIFLTTCSEVPENRTVKVIELRGANCKIFLKHVVWGITGDNSRTYIGNSKYLKDTVNEPYFRALDFFYKMNQSNCSLIISKSDTLHRRHLLKVNIQVFDNDSIDFNNYTANGFDNILYN